MLRVLTSDPTSTNDETDKAGVGTLYAAGNGDVYMYVENAGADTNAVQYKLACNKTAGTRGQMTMDAGETTAGGLGTVTKPAGIWQYAVSFGNFGYILVQSPYCDVYTDDGVADGDALVCDGGATETFIADTAVAGEEHAVFGHALAADNDTTHLVKAKVNFL